MFLWSWHRNMDVLCYYDHSWVSSDRTHAWVQRKGTKINCGNIRDDQILSIMTVSFLSIYFLQLFYVLKHKARLRQELLSVLVSFYQKSQKFKIITFTLFQYGCSVTLLLQPIIVAVYDDRTRELKIHFPISFYLKFGQVSGSHVTKFNVRA